MQCSCLKCNCSQLFPTNGSRHRHPDTQCIKLIYQAGSCSLCPANVSVLFCLWLSLQFAGFSPHLPSSPGCRGSKVKATSQLSCKSCSIDAPLQETLAVLAVASSWPVSQGIHACIKQPFSCCHPNVHVVPLAPCLAPSTISQLAKKPFSPLGSFFAIF